MTALQNEATLDQVASQTERIGTEPRSRLYFVDNLRAALTILVVIHHLAVTYGAIAIWYYVEPPQNAVTPLVMLFIVLFNQAFFMGCFFLIAGYFTPGSYEHKGSRAFLRDRLVRLGIPLFVYTLLINPVVSFIGYSSLPESIRPGPLLPFWQFYPFTVGPGPLWFVEALLFFSLLYALWHGIFRKRLKPAADNGEPPTYFAIAAFTLILTLVTFLLRIWIHMGFYLPVVGFPTASHLPQYTSLFSLGILAYRRSWFVSIPDSMGKAGFITAIGASILLVPLVIGGGTDAFLGGANWHAFTYSLWESIFCVGMCIGLLTLFRRRFNRQGAVWKFLSSNTYTVYIIHGPLIVGLAIALRDVHIYPLLKFAMVVPIAVLLCFLSAFIVRRLPIVRDIL